MCLPVIDSVLARFNQPGDKILLTEAVIYGERLGKRRSATSCCSWSRIRCAGSWTRLGESAAIARDRRGTRRRASTAQGTRSWTEDTVTVKMAEMDVVTDGRRLKTILGSCVGIILRDPDRRVSGLAHIMLPARQRDDDREREVRRHGHPRPAGAAGEAAAAARPPCRRC